MSAFEKGGGWGAEELEDLVDLVDLAVALEERSAEEELSEDASNRPYVHRERVILVSEKDFRCTVPQCLDFMRYRVQRNPKHFT